MTDSRLSERQRSVLTALAQLGQATVPELRAHFPRLAPSAIHRVLQALAGKSLVGSSGDPSQVYLGGVVFWAIGGGRAVDERLEVIHAELREAGVPFDAWIDLDGSRVVVLVPVVQWVWGLIAYDTPELICLRDALVGLRGSGYVDTVRMGMRVTTDMGRREAFALELLPSTP